MSRTAKPNSGSTLLGYEKKKKRRAGCCWQAVSDKTLTDAGVTIEKVELWEMTSGTAKAQPCLVFQ